MVAAALVATAGVTSGAAAQGGAPAAAPQVQDVCGDADTRLAAAGRSQSLETAQPARDLAGARFFLTYGPDGAARALVTEVDACGPASDAVEALVQIGFQDACVLNVRYVPRRLGEIVLAPQVRVTEECFDGGAGAPTTGAREVSRLTLPAAAASFAGTTTRMEVPLAAVPAVTAPRLAPGTVWDASAAVLGDPDVGSFALAGGSFPDPDAAVVVRYDVGFGSGYVVGQDAPER